MNSSENKNSFNSKKLKSYNKIRKINSRVQLKSNSIIIREKRDILNACFKFCGKFYNFILINFQVIKYQNNKLVNKILVKKETL
jgi:hypothetical protein